MGDTSAVWRALANVIHYVRAHDQHLAAVASQLGLTGRQLQALIAIAGSPSRRPTIGDIAARMVVHPHSASEMVSRMERFVRRVESQTDRREAVLELTDAGRAALNQFGFSLAYSFDIAHIVDLYQAITEFEKVLTSGAQRDWEDATDPL